MFSAQWHLIVEKEIAENTEKEIIIKEFQEHFQKLELIKQHSIDIRFRQQQKYASAPRFRKSNFVLQDLFQKREKTMMF